MRQNSRRLGTPSQATNHSDRTRALRADYQAQIAKPVDADCAWPCLPRGIRCRPRSSPRTRTSRNLRERLE